MENVRCARCGGAAEEGFIADSNLANVIPSTWVAGAPESSFWTGVAGVKVGGKVRRRVQTFRCTACGHLESFATGEWAGASRGERVNDE
jgi:hypothetical protein